ncbi:MAG: hypothetical protein ACPGVU_04620 [Limisphaerales bacterium]
MKPILLALLLLSNGVIAAPVRVFILAGQSNMEGKAKVSLIQHQLGVGGVNPDKPNPGRDAFKAAQAEAAARKEFKGTVTMVKTDQYWDETADAVFKKGWKKNFELWQTVGSDYPFPYLGSTKTYCDIGNAFGEAMIALQK